MRQLYLYCKFPFFFLSVLLFNSGRMKGQACEAGTPTFTVNLSNNSSASYTSPSVTRNGTCCPGNSDPCVKFIITLHPNSMGINWLHTGADPGGSLQYQVGCGTATAGGTPVCLIGVGPHTMTICKPGGNSNVYYISSVPKPVLPDSIMVRSGCTQTLSVSGFSVPTIRWNAVNSSSAVANYSAAYNGYLSCVSGCSVTVVTPTATPPAWIDYEVSGYGAAPCIADFYRDTVRVYFFSDLLASVNTATICAGQINALLTLTASGGKAPLSHTWSTGSNAQSITVGAGTYSVFVQDGTGCPPVTATTSVLNFTLPITITGGTDRSVCKTNPSVSINHTVAAASGGSWTTSGTGGFAPTPTANPVTYNPSASDLSAGSVSLFVTSTGNQGCQPDQDTVVVTFQNSPSVTVVPSVVICANNAVASLSVNITGYSPATPVWSAAAGNTITSPNSLNTSFNPGSAAINGGSVNVTISTANNGACPPATATTVVFITPSPSVNAGPDLFICTNSVANLNGTVTLGANSGSWTSTGNGVFSNVNSLSTSYTPGSSDLSAGSATLVLKSTANGLCLQMNDTLRLTFAPLTTVNINPVPPICSNSNTINLSGTVTGAANTGTWSASGTGNFSANSAGSGIYNLNQNDQALSQLVFTLTSTNNTVCPSTSNTITVNLFAAPVSAAGINSFICSTNNPVSLSGVITGGAGTGSWTTNGSGIFTGGSNSVQANYLMSAADINNGAIVFTLSSTNNGPCASASSTLLITVKKQATVTAGPSQSVCATNLSIPISGVINGGSGSVIWSSSGTGSFSPASTFISANYQASSADIVNGNILLTLTSTNDAPCVQDFDTLRLRISLPAQVNTGTYSPICSNAGTVLLNGSISGGNQNLLWVSSGNGSFSPNANSSVAGYKFTQADVSNGSVNFTISSINNGACPADSRTTSILIRQQPSVTAVADQSICSTKSSITLDATLSGVSKTGIWTTSGTGTFTPNDITINSTYLVSANDINTGKVSFIIITTSNDVCPGAKDTMNLLITKFPVVKLQGDTTICSSDRQVSLNPQITNGNGNYRWTTSGSGSFDPDLFSVPSTYLLSDQDAGSPGVVLTLNALNNGACGTISSNFLINIKPSPFAGFVASMYTVSLPGEPVVFTNTTENGGSYRWEFGDGTTSTNPSPVKSFTETGFYFVTLTARNQYDCTDTITQQITVIKEALVPTAFTPNGDKLNSTFRILTDGVTDYDLMIFNRWGELIFRSNKLEIGWDGTFNGKECQQDAYVWKARIKFFDGRTFDKVGSITLLR